MCGEFVCEEGIVSQHVALHGVRVFAEPKLVMRGILGSEKLIL